MLHQIDLYRSIPTTRSAIREFIEETKDRLTGVTAKDYSSRNKYHDRLDKARKALDSLSELHRCLNE